jgi:phosphoglycerate dehydrogenase-like enzyme
MTADAPAALARADILFGPPDVIASLLDSAPQLRWVQSSWAGVRPLVDHPRRDYVLTGVRGIFGQPMTEYVLGWLLALERRIIERAGQGCWDERIEAGVRGKRIGILGTGDIARAVARGCAVLGIDVIGLNSDGRDVPGFSACYPVAERLGFAAGVDYLLGLLPDTPATGNLVDAALLDRLAPGAIFINAGRANSVVDDDLLAALAQGPLRAAVLDVTREEPLPATHPFWAAQNLYLTSHTAAPTGTAAVARVFAANYERFRRGEALADRVDFDRGY